MIEVARAYGLEVSEIPKRFGRRKLKLLWNHLVEAESEAMLRAATAARAGTLADDKVWREFTRELSKPPVPDAGPPPPPVLKETNDQNVDDEEWETIDG